MYFWFDETKQLLDLYLKTTRKKFTPTTDSLILSNQKGRWLSPAHCSTRVRLLCEKFGIKTYHGKIPSPHTLRHTFATLNIEPIGLSLSLYDMAQRLRHSKVETTRRHYIHNNPYLNKIKHAVQRKNNRIKTPKDILNGMSLADLEHWFSDTLELDSNTILKFRLNHKKKFDSTESQVDKKETDTKMFVTESEALEILKELQVTPFALRNYALKKGGLSNDFEGSSRYGKKFRYQKDFIEDLARNWVLAELLRSKRNWTERKFYRLLENEKWRTLKLGKSLYVNRADYI